MAVLRSLLFYTVFYGGSVVLVLAALACLPFGNEAVQRVSAAWSGFHRICLRWLVGVRVRVEGTLPAEPVLYAIKHESFFEAIDLPTLLERPVVFAKEELLSIPGWGRVGKAYGLVPVARDQGARALRAMIEGARSLSGGIRPLAIFPEGTRVRHGTDPVIQSGFAGLYKLMGLAVVPIAVDSGPLYHRAWKRPGTITYKVGETIPPGLPRVEVEMRVHAAINALNTGKPASARHS